MGLIPWLVVLVCVSAAAFYIGGRKGLFILCALVVIAATVVAVRSPEGAMFVGYVAAFALLPIVAALGIGSWSASRLKRGHMVLGLLPLAAVGVLVWMHYRNEMAQVDEHHQVIDFMMRHRQLAALAGSPLKFNLASSTKYSDDSRAKYEFSLAARKPLYAIVDVDRKTKPATIRLRCVTSRPAGKRGASADDCAADVVALDDTSWAVARPPDPAASEPFLEIPPIPRDTAVHVIGVYQAKNQPATVAGAHQPGDVVVNVAAGKKPVLLVLTSYEPVKWEVRNQGRTIVAVLTSGYHRSTVTGTDAKVAHIGRDWLGHTERQGGPMETRARRYAAGPYTSQAVYSGVEFTVPAK